MTSVNLVTVAEGTSLEQAEVVHKGIRSKLPVINKDGKLVGLITLETSPLTQNQMVIKTFTVDRGSSSSYRCYG
jgi:IMP dehydrogenase